MSLFILLFSTSVAPGWSKHTAEFFRPPLHRWELHCGYFGCSSAVFRVVLPDTLHVLYFLQKESQWETTEMVVNTALKYAICTLPVPLETRSLYFHASFSEGECNFAFSTAARLVVELYIPEVLSSAARLFIFPAEFSHLHSAANSCLLRIIVCVRDGSFWKTHVLEI